MEARDALPPDNKLGVGDIVELTDEGLRHVPLLLFGEKARIVAFTSAGKAIVQALGKNYAAEVLPVHLKKAAAPAGG